MLLPGFSGRKFLSDASVAWDGLRPFFNGFESPALSEADMKKNKLLRIKGNINSSLIHFTAFSFAPRRLLHPTHFRHCYEEPSLLPDPAFRRLSHLLPWDFPDPGRSVRVRISTALPFTYKRIRQSLCTWQREMDTHTRATFQR